MIIYIALIIFAFVAFALGWTLGRKKFNNETAVQVIENLKANMQINDITHKDQMSYLSQKYTDLKIDVMKCMEENKTLKEEINKLKK